ncbi:methyltransferase domain-containing protein [Agrococcus sp. Ld7]|uniref:methyltransferase domain-containing protein n=1 Tax=Agrococcus sp. Ld7 TaxID=649148 RepID=UPI00386B3ACB
MTTPQVQQEIDRAPEQGVAVRSIPRCIGILNDAAAALLISVGHQTGLFDSMKDLPASSSEQIAAVSGCDERYVREWLHGMTAARIVDYDPTEGTFALPSDFAAILTRAAGPNNIALITQYIAMMGEVEQLIIDRFRTGGGLSYSDYPRFHRTMSEVSAAVFDAALVHGVLPLVPGLPSRLAAGIDVADIGCGSGRAINLMAAAFPNSRFTGYDFSEPAISQARAEATQMQLSNADFTLSDVATLQAVDRYDLITAFDAVHDQAHPGTVLENIRTALRDDGRLLMVEFNASSNVEDNINVPWGGFLYAMSTFHCMSVSLGLGGDGLGAAWGVQLADRMLREAGFGRVETQTVESDPFNVYFIASKH